MSLSIHDVYHQIFKIWRKKRFALFIQRLSPNLSDRLLDVGGTPSFWASHAPVVGSIHTLNIYPEQLDPQFAASHHISVLVGDGCKLQMADKSYDIAFSNSVIEHVQTFERQFAFATEIRRVGSAVWVQTPARECWFESHYLAPFIHWLPKSLQKKLVRYFTPRGLIERLSAEQINDLVDNTRLLSYKEMKILFPDCEIHTERMFGFMPKSYIAIKQKV
jgi:hypothetical protein